MDDFQAYVIKKVVLYLTAPNEGTFARVLYDVEHNKKVQNKFSVIPTKHLAMSMDILFWGKEPHPFSRLML